MSWDKFSTIRVNSSPPRQNSRHFADDIFRCIFLYEKFCILIQISLKFLPKGPIDKESSLVQVMVWRRTGDKPLPDQCWHTSLTHICGKDRDLFILHSIMAADVLAMHGARASETMILTRFNRDDWIPTHQGLKVIIPIWLSPGIGVAKPPFMMFCYSDLPKHCQIFILDTCQLWMFHKIKLTFLLHWNSW